MKWEQLTVGQYLDLYRLSINTQLSEIEKSERAVSICYDMTERQVEQMRMGEFITYAQQINKFLSTPLDETPGKPVKKFKIGKRWFRIIYDPTRLRHRQYVEVIHFGEKPVENMNKILASIVVPLKWGWLPMRNRSEDHEQLSALMTNAPVTVVYHAAVFFCKLYINLIDSIRPSLVKQMTRNNQMTAETAEILLEASLRGMAGFTARPAWPNTKG